MRVLLTRPQAQSEDLGARLRARGCDWLGEPLLRIVPVPWDPDVLAEPQALLLTSANASRALLQVPGVRRNTLIFAVGPATAAPLRAAGFSDVHAAGGTAVDLMDLIRRRIDPQAGRLLHLGGYDIAVDLAAGLAPDGFKVDRTIVYRACTAERLSARAVHEISQNRIDSAVFLSARTAAAFCELASRSGITGSCARMTAVAISRKVAEALRPAPFRQVAVAATPSLDAVLDAVCGRLGSSFRTML